MHVVHVGAQTDPLARLPAVLLDAWPTLAAVPAALAAAGVRCDVVHASHADARFDRDGVAFHFVDARRQAPARIAARAASLAPDVLHLHGLEFTRHMAALREALPGVPLLVQDHGARVPRRPRRREWRRALERADAFAFTSTAQALPFARAGLLPPDARVFAVPESSTRFRPGDGESARRALGVGGDPCIAWVGRLDPNKDPLTALHGFARAAERLPDARLWICHGDAPLLARVRGAIERDPMLHERVRLLGPLEHEHVERLLRAADLFVSASHRESTGYALIEALACGATPVVTDIPSYRELLAHGAVGALFPPGDADALARALVDAASAGRDAARAEARRHFEAQLSFEALARRLVAVYAALGVAAPTSNAIQAGRAAARAPARRLRVALVVPGGVDRSGIHRVIPCLLWLIERLAREVELHVIAMRQEPHAATYPLHGAAVHCLPSGARRVRALRMLLDLHGRFDFDLWHAVWMHPQGTLAGAAGALTRRPVVVHLNGGDLARLPDIAYGGRVTRRGRFWLRAAVAGASHVTVPSEAMRRAAEALGIRAEVVTFGVATDRWPPRAPRPRPPNEPARLLHVASLNRVKDQPTLLRALSLLRDRGVCFRTDIVGEDTLGGVVQQLSSQIGLQEIVRFQGPFPHGRLRTFFDEAHALVLSSRHEADPIVALEAAIAGVPTAGTAVGHLADWAPDAAVTAPTGNAAALADAIATLLEDDDRRRAIAREAQRRALAVDANAGAARLLRIYENVTSAPALRSGPIDANLRSRGGLAKRL